MSSTDMAASNALPLELNFAGRSFLLTSAEGSDSVAVQMQQGGYEAPLPILVMAVTARTTGIFLDVGTNNGLYSVLAAITKPEAHAVAFEPYPPVLQVLRENIRLNNLEQRIRVVETALSDTPGVAQLFLPDQAHGLLETSCSLEADFKPGLHQQIEVVKARLDDVSFNENISLIKVDIEGHEAAFFRGAQSTLKRDRPVIFAEMLPPAKSTFAEVSSFMAEMDYFCFRLRPDLAILVEVIKHDHLAWNYALIPRESLDMFRSICSFHQIEILQTF